MPFKGAGGTTTKLLSRRHHPGHLPTSCVVPKGDTCVMRPSWERVDRCAATHTVTAQTHTNTQTATNITHTHTHIVTHTHSPTTRRTLAHGAPSPQPPSSCDLRLAPMDSAKRLHNGNTMARATSIQRDEYGEPTGYREASYQLHQGQFAARHDVTMSAHAVRARARDFRSVPPPCAGTTPDS